MFYLSFEKAETSFKIQSKIVCNSSALWSIFGNISPGDLWADRREVLNTCCSLPANIAFSSAFCQIALGPGQEGRIVFSCLRSESKKVRITALILNSGFGMAVASRRVIDNYRLSLVCTEWIWVHLQSSCKIIVKFVTYK